MEIAVGLTFFLMAAATTAAIVVWIDLYAQEWRHNRKMAKIDRRMGNRGRARYF